MDKAAIIAFVIPYWFYALLFITFTYLYCERHSKKLFWCLVFDMCTLGVYILGNGLD